MWMALPHCGFWQPTFTAKVTPEKFIPLIKAGFSVVRPFNPAL
jgi:hypothetical protein